jgi:catechol 2,3-dioxygenase-like lactoylglutathione lyase family enzyme
MSQGVQVVGLYVRDQDEAVQFYVEKLGFRIHTDVRNGDYRWLTVQHPDQPSFQLGLFKPQSPMLDAATAQTVREIVAKGAMPPLVLVVEDCRAAYDRMRARGVEFTQEPVDRYGTVDAGFRDPAGNEDDRGAAKRGTSTNALTLSPASSKRRPDGAPRYRGLS